jgi:hypothetical protein
VVSLPTFMLRKQSPVPVVNSWTALDAQEKWIDRTKLPQSGLQEVQSAGAGVMLIRCSVFQKIPAPWFNVLRDPKMCTPLCGEDDYFCARVRDAHLKIHTHSGYQCGHLKTVDLSNS